MLLPKDANYEIQIQESSGLSAYRLTSKTESPAPKYEPLWWRFPEGNLAAERLNVS
jgi:hypothetical protein